MNTISLVLNNYSLHLIVRHHEIMLLDVLRVRILAMEVSYRANSRKASSPWITILN